MAVNIVKSTLRYEAWLGSQTPIVKADLRLKHRRMAEGAFPFLRATFYRWMQIWPEAVAGLGSLGRIRLVALAECNGGKIAREAKALVPSSVNWAHGSDQPELMYQVIINRAVRSPDPFVQMRGQWIARRLSPHCCRIELSVLPKGREELRLLFAMGWETANIHLGSRSKLRQIRRHLDRMKPGWLSVSARCMADAVTRDWRAWRKSGGS